MNASLSTCRSYVEATPGVDHRPMDCDDLYANAGGSRLGGDEPCSLLLQPPLPALRVVPEHPPQELLPEVPRQAELGAVAQEHHGVAAEPGLEPDHSVHVHEEPAVNPREPRRIQLLLQPVGRAADEVRALS